LNLSLHQKLDIFFNNNFQKIFLGHIWETCKLFLITKFLIVDNVSIFKINLSIPKFIHVVILTSHRKMEEIEYRSDVKIPIPKEDEVLVNVKGAGINNTDINTRIGWYSKSSAKNIDNGSWLGNPLDFPIIQGADILGNIVIVEKPVVKKELMNASLSEQCKKYY